MENNYYVYILLNPSRNDEPFYVGMGSKKRVKAHFLGSQLKYKSYKNNTIKNYRSLGYKDEYIFLIENISKEEALFQEIYWIAYFGRVDCNEGILTNNTDGGNIPSDRDKISYKTSKKYGTYWTEGRLKCLSTNKELFIKNNTGANSPLLKLAKQGKHPATLASKNPDKQWFKGEKSNFYGIEPWNNVRANDLSKYTWKLADKIYEKYIKNINCTHWTLFKDLESEYKISRRTIESMFFKFKSGWIPSQDLKWLEFKKD